MVEICENPWQLPKVLVFLFVNSNTWLHLLILQQLGFYFNGVAQCSLYLIHTEHTKMACSMAPVEKCWPVDVRGGMMGEGWAAHLACELRRGRELAVVSISASTEETESRPVTLAQRSWGLPRELIGKESACQGRRRGFNPWVWKIPWEREWQPTPVFLPGEPHGQRTLVGYRPCGHKESDKTEWPNNSHREFSLRGSHTIPDSWHVSSVNATNTSLSFLCISSVHIVNLSRTFHF